MSGDRFTPARERARRETVVAWLRTGTLAAPPWLLCPLAERRLEIEHAVAQAGGGFFRAVDWVNFAQLLDQRLGLPFAAPLDEADRVFAVERRLEELATRMPSLGEAIGADPFGVARAVLGVADTLRAHGWDADIDNAPLQVVAPQTRDVVHRHIALLAFAVRAAETAGAQGDRIDTLARIRRVTAALRGGREAGVARVVVEGIDRLRPLERDLLRALRAQGCVVDVAPWVLGWERDAAPGPGALAPSLREALTSGAASVDDPGDRSVDAVRVRDPHEEAELVAQWIAERVARGDQPGDFAISVGGSAGAADRVVRALARWGVTSAGAGRVEVRASALWQVVRASVRLAWGGVDAVDLATVLAAPGSGVWGGERDRFTAALRRALPTTWRSVRDLAAEVFDEAGDDAEADVARQKRRAEARRGLEALVESYESIGPFARLAAVDRRTHLRRAVETTLDRLVRSERFAEAVIDPRDQTVWLLASQAIESALRVALDRLDERRALLPATEPGFFLGAVESLLGSVDEDRAPPRDAGVTILEGHAAARRRPRVLVVTGFVRGRHPAPPPIALLLGPQERAVLDASLGPDDALPSDEAARAVSWRETQRLLALPAGEILLVVPERGVDGSRVEPSLTWRDLLARMHPERRAAWEREGIPHAGTWLAGRFPEGFRSVRAIRDEAVAALGAGAVGRALALAGPLTGDLATRDFFAACLRPERRYEVGDLVRAALSTTAFRARDLESALTCRYRFLATSLLGLRPSRVARFPSVTGRDRTRVTRAALRLLDAREATGEGSIELDDVLDEALRTTLPWAQRAETHGAVEELRRGVRAFLAGYTPLRQRWGAARGLDLADGEDLAEVPITLDEARTVRVRLDAPRVELRATRGDPEPIAVDFTLRALDGLPRLRDLGLDLDAALAPFAVRALAPEVPLSAFVRLSLAKPAGDVLAARGAASLGDDRIVPFETVASATPLRVERQRRLEDHQDHVLGSLAALFTDLDRDDAVYAPHDPEEAERLRDGGAKTCDRCDARLACRFGLEGG